MGHGRHSLAAQAALAGEYPPLPDPKFTRVVDGIPCITLLEHGLLMRAYVDADRAMRAQAAPVAQGDAQQRECIRILRRDLNKSTVLAALLRHGTDAARAQANEGAKP